MSDVTDTIPGGRTESAHTELREHIEGVLGERVLDTSEAFGELTFRVKRAGVADVLLRLRDDPIAELNQLIDICGVDFPARPKRFDVVYHLLSMRHNHRVRLRVVCDEDTPVPTATQVFPNADWYEREAFDMYGIVFEGHPDLRRLLTDYGFEGYPLRKDFPLTGYTEVRYDAERKQVVSEPVDLPMQYRSFDFLSPWEGVDYVLPGDEKAEGGA